MTNGPATPKTLRGRDRKPRRRRNRAATVVDEANIAALPAAGVSRNKIVEVLDLTKTRVDEILRRPEVREFAGRVRQAIQVQQLATVQETLDSTSQWLQDVIKLRDPRAFDAITRGLAALERVASSASGENQRQSVAVAHTLDTNVSAEARQLVAALLGQGPEAPRAPIVDPGGSQRPQERS